MTVTSTTRHPLQGLVLRPGAHVLRRDAADLQVGLDPRRAVVLPDAPAVRSLLAALANPAALPEGDYDREAFALLVSAGLTVDAGVLLPLAPSGPAAPESMTAPGRSDVSAVAAYAGDRASGHVAARRQADVRVLVTGGADAHAVASRVRALLADAGVRSHFAPDAATGTTARASAHGRRAEAAPPTAALLVCVGEPQREEVDALMRSGQAHLLLRLAEGHATVGPFVLPGRTTCLRCIDAHHTDHDPAWPLLLTQYAAEVARERPDSLTEPVDGLLATLAAAWAARELVTYAEGQAPATASATVRLDPLLTALETHAWPRHPACGCSWG